MLYALQQMVLFIESVIVSNSISGAGSVASFTINHDLSVGTPEWANYVKVRKNLLITIAVNAQCL